MAYAIVKVGGKQYRVEKGDELVVDRLREDQGAKVALEPLLFRPDKGDAVFGGDDLGKVKVEATVKGHERGPKIHGLKFKPKRGYKVRYGHRSELTRLEIGDIKQLTRKPAATKAETAAKPKAEAAAASRRRSRRRRRRASPRPRSRRRAPPSRRPKKPAAKKPAAKKPAAKKPAPKKETGDGS